MKILLFGLGSIGLRHAKNLHALGHHVVGADPFAARPEPDGTIALHYTDWHRALADHGDAAGCVIASPTAAHYKQIAGVLLSAHLQGNHIPLYCEKPILTVDDYMDLDHMWSVDSMRQQEKCVVGFQYFFHPYMPSVARLAAKHGALEFSGQDQLVERYGPDVEGVMVAHPLATALRLLGPAADVALTSDGVRLTGHVTHASGAVSRYDFRMDAGPRESWAGAGGSSVALTPDDGMYRACIGAWTAWLAGGPRDARLSSLADGLAVTDVLARVRRTERA
jgi:hypothetical protein